MAGAGGGGDGGGGGTVCGMVERCGARAAGAAAQAKAVASAFEAARAATVHPLLVAANRNAFAQLVMSNWFGLNAR